jgi:uncharacterized protein YprB with RNaseH-like and TPR domain
MKILVFDIETAGVNAFKADLGWVISISYKWLGEGKVQNMMITDFKAAFKKNPHNDYHLLKEFKKVIDQADFLCAHYGSVFDKRFLNGRLKVHNLGRIAPRQLIDTCMIARAHFTFSSNRLANLAKVLGCKSRKMEKGEGWPNWWYQFMGGNPPPSTIRDMKKYNNIDVLTLEEIAIKLREYWPSWINYSVGKEIDCCPSCGGEHLVKNGTRMTGTGKKQTYLCKDCGSVCQSKSSIFTGGMRKC